jgi:hypothetical protein
VNRDYAECAIHISHLENHTVSNYSLDAPDIADVRSRIAVHQDYVSQLARSD